MLGEARPIGRGNDGTGFEAGFSPTSEVHDLARWYTDPKTRRIDTRLERHNRTLPESFVDFHEDRVDTSPRLLQPN